MTSVYLRIGNDVIKDRVESKVRCATGRSALDGGRAIERVTLLGGETWTALARWARETNNLEEKQRTLAMSIGRTIGNGKGIAAKRAIEAEKALEEAIRKGFRCRTLVVA